MLAHILILNAGLIMIAAAESWSLPVVNTHFMGNNSGIGNGTWPPSSVFPSSVDFIFRRTPGDNGTLWTSAACSANWTASDYPKNWKACNDTTVVWRFANQPGTFAANFTLEIIRAEIANPADATEQNATAYIGYANVHVSANNNSDDSSYLTCISGPPLTGIQCSTNGVDGIQLGSHGAVPLTPNFTYYQLESWELPKVSIVTAGNLERTNCTRTIEFNATEGVGEAVLAMCSDVLACSPWPVDTQPFPCMSDQDSYTWWWETVPNASRFPPIDSKLVVQRTYFLVTDFVAVDGVAVALKVQVTAWSWADVGSQLVDEGCANDRCVTDTGGDRGMVLLVDRFDVVEDGRCMLAQEN